MCVFVLSVFISPSAPPPWLSSFTVCTNTTIYLFALKQLRPLHDSAILYLCHKAAQLVNHDLVAHNYLMGHRHKRRPDITVYEHPKLNVQRDIDSFTKFSAFILLFFTFCVHIRAHKLYLFNSLLKHAIFSTSMSTMLLFQLPHQLHLAQMSLHLSQTTDILCISSFRA